MINARQKAAPKKVTRIKALRAKLSDEWYAYFNQEGLLAHADTLARRKKYLLHVIRHRLKPHIPGTRALVSYSDLRGILHAHRDCAPAKGAEAKRKWVARAIVHLKKLPCVFDGGTYILLLHFNADHGSDEAINAHHVLVAKSTAHNKARWAQEERTRAAASVVADAPQCTPQPVVQNVEIDTSCRLPTKTSGLYRSNTPTPKQPKHPRSSIVATQPMPTASAKQGNIPGFGCPPAIPSYQPQQLAKPVSFRSRSDNAPSTMRAILRRPTCLDGFVPPKRAPAGNFDPRTNPAAKRLPVDGHLSMTQVLWLSRQDTRLRGLSYAEMYDVDATDDLLLAAYHLFTLKKDRMTHPKGYLKWLVKQLRAGAYRYAD